jgi:TPR repeat protein
VREAAADPHALGVHRSRRSGDGSELPPYVVRDADAALEQALLRAAEKGGAVVVEGDSTAGKSRALLHALTSVFPDRVLFTPAPEEDVSALAGRLAARPVRKGAVVWLDDLHRYIGRGERGLTESVLAGLVRSGVVVAATLRTERVDYYASTEASAPDGSERVRGDREAGAALLRRFTRLHLDRLWSEAEVQRAADSGDGRLAEAAAHHGEHGIAEYLAAGPELLRRWQDARRHTARGGHPRGHAVVAAAVDLARTGLLTAPDAALLEQTHTTYLDGTASLQPEPFDQALAWACKSVLGASGLLVAADIEGRRWRAFDYLVEDTSSPIPPPVWQAALDHASDDDERIDVAIGAYEAEHRALAVAAIAPLADAGHPRAMNFMGYIAHGDGRAEDAERWYRQAAAAGDTGAMYNLGVLWRMQGKVVAAEELYEWAADAGNTSAMVNLGVLREEQGKTEAAEEFYQRAAAAGDTDAMVNLGVLRRKQGKTEAAEELFRRAADAGNTDAMVNLGMLREKQGKTEAAEEFYQRAAAAGHTLAMVSLGVLRREQGKTEAAEEFYQRAAAAGDTDAMVNLGVLRAEQGKVVEAEELFQRAVDAGHTSGMYNLAVLREQQGKVVEAEELYRRAADAGNTLAMNNLRLLREDRGETGEASTDGRPTPGTPSP